MASSDPITDDALLEAEGVKKYFPVHSDFLSKLLGNQDYVKAVDGVDLSLSKNDTVGLVGESGCGKTTLGRVLANLYPPTDGTIRFRGRPIEEMSQRLLRKNIQVTFQDPLSSLNPRKTVVEIVGKPLRVHDIVPENEIRDRVVELFNEVGLQESHLDRYPHEFSGGQRQRIGIARALAPMPELIIADEPVSALDVSVQAKIINLLEELQERYEISYLFISHDLSVVKHISDRVFVMYLGKIVESGPVDAIFNNPQHPYTRALLKTIPRLDGEFSFQDGVLEKEIPSVINRPSGCPFHTRCPEYIGSECRTKEPVLEPSDDMPAHFSACHWNDYSEEKRHTHGRHTHPEI